MQDFDNMPIRESMRDSHKEENKSLMLDDYPPVNEDLKKNYRVIDRKLKRSITRIMIMFILGCVINIKQIQILDI